MGTPLPSEVKEKIESMESVRNLVEDVLSGFLITPVKTSGYSRLNRVAYQLKARDRIGDKAWYLLRFFKRLDTILTTQRKFIRPYSILSLSSRLHRMRL